MSKKLIVANWKMAPQSLAEAKKTFAVLKRTKFSPKNVKVVICPPNIYFADIVKNYKGGVFSFGAQNVHMNNFEATTGETSAGMIADAGARFVMVGHAERRAMGETNDMVAQKLSHVITSGLTPILCVGEIERDMQGLYLRFVEQQLLEAFASIDKKHIHKIVIAYEPLWAMGAGHTAVENREIHQMSIFIKKILVSQFGRKVGMTIPIIYGGSVDADNCVGILNEGEVDGLLIGRASLNPHTFSDIVRKIAGNK